MRTAYFKGCLRISCPVTKSRDFRAIISKKVPDKLATLAALDRSSLVGSYIEHLRSELRRVSVYNVERTDISLFGKTENNLKEFKFFLGLLETQGIESSHSFFRGDDASAPVKVPVRLGKVYDDLIKDTESWLLTAEVITAEHLFQHLQYTRNYLEARYSYDNDERDLPKLAVVANDHSFAQVGFIAAMESLDVPVVYVQHAEVSDIFPPLDFTASILRNKVSLDIYSNIGPVKGETFVISRNSGSIGFHQVLEPLSSQAIVGIYPTSQWELTPIRRAVDRLRANPAVRDYFVKPHPRSKLTLTEGVVADLRIRSTIPDERHVALAGNSSVVVDLLGRGHAVYQLFELDTLQPDYYGFVGTGLAPAVTGMDLEEAFWAKEFYNEDWLKRACLFEPAMNEDQQLERVRLGAFMKRLLKRRRQAKFIRHLFARIGGSL